LGGAYITAEDVGTNPADMEAIAEVTSHVAGRPTIHGGSGDPSPFTARTVLGAIESAVRLRLGTRGMEGIRVGVQGVGHVGEQLTSLLREAGALVYVTDVDRDRMVDVAARLGATALPLEGFSSRDFDVFAPCALGAAIGAEDLDRLRAHIVAGAANNPLAEPRLAAELRDRGVLYVPDFLANCGGIIHVGSEALGLEDARSEELIAAAIDRTDSILSQALSTETAPLDLAEEQVARRLSTVHAESSAG
jgi:leucine dehydrogenase